MSSDRETSDSCLSDTEPYQGPIPRDIAAAYKRGSLQVVHKGNQYIWKEHEDNESAFTESSIIWRLGDEYERVGNNCLKKYRRCGRAVGPQLANPGRNLYSIHSFLHTNLLILVPNVSPILEIPRKDVTPIGSGFCS